MPSPIVTLARGLGLSRGTRPMAGEAAPPPMWAAQQTHPGAGESFDPARVQSVLLQSEQGQLDGLQDLYDDLRERDARLDAVCRQRVLALAGRDWSLQPPPGLEDDDDAADVADRAGRLLAEIPSLSRVIANAADAVLRGYSVQEIVWPRSRDPRGYLVPERIVWRHAARFAIDDQLQLRKWDFGDPFPGIPLAEFGPAKWILHQPTAGRTSYPHRQGALRACIFPALTKRYGIRWWLRAAERFGQPAVIVRITDASGDKAVAAAAARAVRQLTDDWAAVLGKGLELDQVPGTGTVNGELHQRLADFANTEIAVAVLGQNLTTEISGSSGSRAAVEGHERVLGTLLQADAAELEDTLTQQLVAPLMQLNFPGEPIPRWSFQLVEDEQREPQEWHVERGIVSRNEVREWLGRPPVSDDDGLDPDADPAALSGRRPFALGW